MNGQNHASCAIAFNVRPRKRTLSRFIKKSFHILAAAAVVSLLVLTGTSYCGDAEGAQESSNGETIAPAARVNGVPITRDRLRVSIESHVRQQGIDRGTTSKPEEDPEIRRTVLDGLISQELLWQEAKRKNIVAADDEVQRVVTHFKRKLLFEEAFQSMLEDGGFTEESYTDYVREQLSVGMLLEEDIARDVSVSDREIQEYHAANPDRFSTPVEVRVRHIIIKAGSDLDEGTRREVKKKANRILEEARGGADFTELAKKHSEDSSGPRGGDLGFISRGSTVRPFEEAAFSLRPGEISGVVETQYGYHIIKVEELKGGNVKPLAAVTEEVRQLLFKQKVQSAVQDRVKALRENANVEILLQ